MLYWIFIWSLVWSVGLLGAQTVTYDILTQVCGLQKLVAIAKIIVLCICNDIFNLLRLNLTYLIYLG